MSNVINLRKVKRRRAEHRTLCTHGFHKWETLSQRTFDVKQGKLVTTQRCKHCGAQRTKAI